MDINEQKNALNADVVIIGGSIGGTLAAYSSAKNGKTVIITETTDWLGGQFTSQAVPADEHAWIEKQGCTLTYRQFRENVRNHYRACPQLLHEHRQNPLLNPGGGLVSRISAEPKILLEQLMKMLSPFVDSGLIKILYNTEIDSAKVTNNQIDSVSVKSGGKLLTLKGKYFMDATDCGDLLPEVGAEYTMGAESQAQTGELHAAEVSERLDIQPITHCAAIDFRPNQKESGTESPTEYEFFRKFLLPCDTRHSVLSFFAPNLNDHKSRRFKMFDTDEGNYFPLFPYRQIIKSDYYEKGFQPYDVTIVNWPQNDYFMGNIYGSEDAENNKYMARQLTLSVIHWLNTEAETASGNKGYRGFNLRGDVLGTADGLAKSPYIRESRRIVPVKTITENMICKELNPLRPRFDDSVGVGSYHIDVHMTTKTRSFFFYEVQPFEIPLSAMVPIRLTNLIASCKNIGTTHLTNGCYRLHPVEWNIGEAAGHLASYCIDRNILPLDVCNSKSILKDYQEMLKDSGLQLSWRE